MIITRLGSFVKDSPIYSLERKGKVVKKLRFVKKRGFLKLNKLKIQTILFSNILFIFEKK